MASTLLKIRHQAGSDIGRKSPTGAPARARERASVLSVVSSDPKYKKYSQQVEKCLTTFETMHEWPDLIAFLNQLLKTLQSYTQFKEIPRKLVVAKRLSQCLNPALPSGVHQRALDVYSHILSVLGSDGLKRDLQLWSSGLFPFFEYASTSVKPTLLNLFEVYYFPLQDNLRPIMKSFILALLPGLEEETGEYFEKVMGLLDRLSGTVSPAFFLQNIWLVMLTTQVPRAYALNFLSRRLPRVDGNEDPTAIVGQDLGLMIRAFSAALEDDNLLVRRGALDLLVQCLRFESAVVTRASEADRSILMRAAASVVLRRDLSLNRRLYTWLLGPEEISQKQTKYFATHGLALLRATLLDEMSHPSTEYPDSRPYKIFISLLDKWEIGSLLTEALVYDALYALKTSIEGSTESSEDLLITANSLYEAVEPRAVWKRLFESMRREITATEVASQEAIEMTIFILKNFRQRDEEIQSIHLPLVFSAIVEILTDEVKRDSSRASTASVRAAMRLLEEMLRHTPNTALTSVLEVTDIPPGRGFNFVASTFYGIDVDDRPSYDTSMSSTIPFVATFEGLVDLSIRSVKLLTEGEQQIPASTTWGALAEELDLISILLKSLDELSSKQFQISWDPKMWISELLKCLDLRGSSFLVTDRIISVAEAVSRAPSIQPVLILDDRAILAPMTNILLSYLRPERSPYHVRAVNLLWTLESCTARHHVESIIAQSLTSPNPNSVHEAFETFGVLWRLTEDSMLPGFRFKVPLLAVLDSLKSDDPSLRRIGESWMRCNLKAYTRVLDPILFDLLDPSMLRTETIVAVKGREIRVYSYKRTFDQRQIHYMLDILLHVVRFGGQGIGRVAATTTIERSASADLIDRVSHSGLVPVEATYLDLMVELLQRLLLSEPKPELAKTMHRANVSIHATVIDLLQVIVARGELDPPAIATVESNAISTLFLSVHTSQLDIQNKLLHLLHTTISASMNAGDRRRTFSSGGTATELKEESRRSADAVPSSSLNPLLIQTLIDGMVTSTNRPLLQHWLDFVIMTISQFPQLMSPAVSPLNSCVCRQISLSLNEIEVILSTSAENIEDVTSEIGDADIIMLLNALERLVLFSLPDSPEASYEEIGITSDKGGPDSTSLLTYVSNVFTTETSTSQVREGQLTAQSPGYRSLHDGINVLFSAWALVAQDLQNTSPVFDTMSHLFNRTRMRCRKVFEKLFRVKSMEVTESVVENWYRDIESGSRNPDLAFEIIDFLTSSAQNVVHMLCESILTQLSSGNERSRKQAINPILTDAILFSFLESYLQKLEGPLATQVWNRYLSLAKEIASNVRDYRQQVFPVLKCLTVLAHKITRTSAIEDRKTRKDIQETFGKLLDACILIAGRSFDSGNWIRRTAKDALTANGRESPLPRVASDTKLEEKFAVASPASNESPRLPPAADMVDQINTFLADEALPSLRRFLMENDKVIGACNNIVYYIINPALKGKASPIVEVDDVVLKILEEMSRIPAAIKSWRSPVTELFNDNRFFNARPDAGRKWQPIVKALIDADKTSFGELLGKIGTAPSANIFTNRDYETLLRSMNLRRLSYVVFAAEKNHFLAQLPAIQEKLVDTLRNVDASVIESEVYLCIRVLLCRLSPHNLTSFWPVLLTEMYRIFDEIVTDPPSDGSDDLQSILSACKLLDLLLVLQTEEFQIHQWIFITDTVDAVDRPDGSFPEALMDQLAEITGNLPVTEAKAGDSRSDMESSIVLPDVTDAESSPWSRTMRQPMLRSVKQIDSIRDLAPFFSHISIMSYESVYASGGLIDWKAIEQSLLEDIFEGR
ncbi:hypothetical protein BD410DRAFT_521497 [Rickenella mellea]|uniref:Uncharacterized protein n=1 Tax=Rickenella mellea TaxID=50990 RepID=A0A4Y7QFM5_9AGAM|nr:hypothetical protein BD410DRAFT_521497 [Rickenella mellea]